MNISVQCCTDSSLLRKLQHLTGDWKIFEPKLFQEQLFSEPRCAGQGGQSWKLSFECIKKWRQSWFLGSRRYIGAWSSTSIQLCWSSKSAPIGAFVSACKQGVCSIITWVIWLLQCNWLTLSVFYSWGSSIILPLFMNIWPTQITNNLQNEHHWSDFSILKDLNRGQIFLCNCHKQSKSSSLVQSL